MRNITVKEFIAALEKIENKDVKLLYMNEDDRDWSSEIRIGAIYDKANPSEVFALGISGGSVDELDIDMPVRQGYKEIF